VSKIQTIELADGSKRYRFTADVGKYPDGRRRQQRFTFRRKKDAEAELARITHKRADGTLSPRWNGTVAELCDEYERSAAFGREANTAESYKNALKPARARLGRVRASAVTRQDIEDLRDWMLTEGRRRGGKPGTGLGPRSVRLTIGRRAAQHLQDRIHWHCRRAWRHRRPPGQDRCRAGRNAARRQRLPARSPACGGRKCGPHGRFAGHRDL
jgi:hypothetical protein